MPLHSPKQNLQLAHCREVVLKPSAMSKWVASLQLEVATALVLAVVLAEAEVVAVAEVVAPSSIISQPQNFLLVFSVMQLSHISARVV